MPTFVAAFRTPELTELAASDVLEQGVSGEQLSVVLDASAGARVFSLEGGDGAPIYVEDDLAVGHEGQMPASERYLYESPVGGGISTSTPDDDVSGIGEMDDGQSVAEDFLYPIGPIDRRSEEEDDPNEESADFVSRTDITEHGTLAPGGAVKGADFGESSSLFAMLTVQDIADVGYVLGDGELATALGEAEENVDSALALIGLPDEARAAIESALNLGGGVLAVVVPAGDLEENALAAILKKHNAVYVTSAP
jgi:hypothetical protein